MWNSATVDTGTLYTHGATVTPPGEGENRLYLKVWDTAGNVSDVWEGVYRQDTVGPTISATNGSPTWRTSSIPTISISVSDTLPGSGVLTSKYRWDQSDVDNGTTITNGSTIVVPSDGDHVLYLKAWDVAGNSSSIPTISYRQDRVAPVGSADKSSTTWRNVGLGAITLSASDASPGSGVAAARYRWDNPDAVNGTSFSSGQTIVIPGDGDHQLYLSVDDIAGNRSPIWSGSYRQDLASPTVSATHANDTWQTTTIPSINLLASDSIPGSGVSFSQYRWDNSDTSSGFNFTNAQVISVPSDGDHVLYLRAYDGAGNDSGVWSGRYRQDRVRPTGFADKALGTWSTTAFGPITLTTDDTNPGSGVSMARYRWDSRDASMGTVFTSGQTISVPSEGAHILAIQVWDHAGNTSNEWVGTYNLDTVPPGVSADKASIIWKNTPIGAITIQGTDTAPGSGLSIIKTRWDNPDLSTANPISPGQTVTIPTDGDHILYIQAKDVAGNPSSLWTGTYRQDMIAPTATANGASTAWRTTYPIVTPVFADSGGSGIASMQYRWNSGAWSTWTAGTIPDPGDGDNLLTLRVTDQAGNSTDWQGQYRLDRRAPSGTIAVSNALFHPMRDGVVGITIGVSDNVLATIPYQLIISRSDGLYEVIQSGTVPSGSSQTVYWDAKRSGQYLIGATYTASLVLSDTMNTSSINTSITVTYNEQISSYRYEYGSDAFQWFKKVGGVQWGPVAGNNYVEVRISTSDALRWSPSVRVETNSPIVNIAVVTQNQSLQVFYTDTATAKMYRLWLPAAYAGFSGSTTSLEQGFDYKLYTFSESDYTVFTKFEGESVIKNKIFDFDFGVGPCTFLATSQPGDWFSHIMTGFIKVPDTIPSGNYGFSVNADDGVTVWFNGRTVYSVENVRNQTSGEKFSLVPGGIYPISVIHFELWGPTKMTLRLVNATTGGVYDIPHTAIYTDWNQSDSMNKKMLSTWVPGTRRYMFDNHPGRWDQTDGRLFGWDVEADHSADLGYGAYAGNVMNSEQWGFYTASSFFIRNAGSYRFKIDSDDGHYVELDGVVKARGLGEHIQNSDFTTDLSVGLHSLITAVHDDTQTCAIWVTVTGPMGDYPPNMANQSAFFQWLPSTFGANKVQSIARRFAPISLNPAGLHILSPSQNQVVTTIPTFTWVGSGPTLNSLQLRLTPITVMSVDELTASVPGASVVSIPLSTLEIQMQSKTLDWTQSLGSGSWKWALVGTTGVGGIVSDAGYFEVSPTLVLDGVINYPNPFKKNTKIRYKLNRGVDKLTISIFSVSGRLVRRIDGPTAGTSLAVEYHDVVWDGTDDDGKVVVNGVYIAKVIAESAGDRREVRTKLVKLQ
ncbi:hypothetical protein EBR57_01395 [bacterium]|nr:hypothetical protein [bacterium]